MAVALQDLRRARCWLEPERVTGQALELGCGRRIGADRAGELPHAHPGERGVESLTIPLELERPAEELQAECRRLRVDAVRPADRDGRAVLVRACVDGPDRALEALGDELTRCPHRE